MMLAVDVKPGPELTFGAPRELFREPALLREFRGGITYQSSVDGSRFLALLRSSGASAAPPVIVVTNWQVGLHK